MIEFIVKVCFDELNMLMSSSSVLMLNFRKFPSSFLIVLELLWQLSVTSHELTRTVSLGDCNRVSCRIYDVDDGNRCFQSLKRAGYMKE